MVLTAVGNPALVIQTAPQTKFAAVISAWKVLTVVGNPALVTQIVERNQYQPLISPTPTVNIPRHQLHGYQQRSRYGAIAPMPPRYQQLPRGSKPRTGVTVAVGTSSNSGLPLYEATVLQQALRGRPNN
jgi:hypothetical protein